MLFRPAWGPTQPPIQWVPGALSLGVKRPGREAATHLQLVPRSRIRASIHPLAHTSSWHSAQLSTGTALIYSTLTSREWEIFELRHRKRKREGKGGAYTEGLGCFCACYCLVAFPFLSVHPLGGQSMFVSITIDEARRYFAMSALCYF
jgi:hypothetical protein